MNFVEQLEALEKLESIILKKAAMLAGCQPGDHYRSESIHDLIDALSEAQCEFPIIKENLDDIAILTIIRPILARYGLAFIQQKRIDKNDIARLHSILSHSSGQWLENRSMLIRDHVVMSDKKIAMINILGIILGLETKKPEPVVPEDPITMEQLELLEDELTDQEDLAKMILEQWSLKRLADMPKSKYMTAMKKIREIKLRSTK